MKPAFLSSTDSAAPPDQNNGSNSSRIEIPDHLIPAIRSDHAGEAGAVEIYKGILAVSRDDSVREFARHHIVAETRHLELMEKILPSEHRTRLLPLCRWAGWFTGALPALITAPAVYRTIDAVKTFVDRHYLEQIVALGKDSKYHELRSLLEQCREDEVLHRDDARARLVRQGLIGKLWSGLITQGSRLGVNLAKWI